MNPPEEFQRFEAQVGERSPGANALRTYALHIGLFLLTFFTTTVAGVFWLVKEGFDLSNFAYGLPYSVSILSMLAAHEFGHYFAARYHGVKTTLPYFIPIPPFLLNPFGTMGAVIRIRSPIQSKRALFDIGIAGPIAGLVVTVAILLYGLATLPGKEYLYSIHPEYAVAGAFPETGLTFGDSILTLVLRHWVSEFAFFPPMNEIYHYPYLCVAWFGLFVTALNLIPVGQLDGGHILYAMIGRGQGIIARAFFGILVLIGLSGFVPFLGWNIQPGTVGWLLWAAILAFLIKLDHPPIADPVELDPARRMLGWIVFVIFILSFAPIPFFELLPK
jgi:membrane-associated protease RseP (regulator of RpoE activity)